MLGPTLAEALLGAWADCRPADQAVKIKSLPIRLPAVAAHLPRIRPAVQVPEVTLNRFLGQEGGECEPCFLQILTQIAENEMVFFMHFWYAFDVVVATMQECGAQLAEAGGLCGELQVVRDVFLHFLEQRSGGGTRKPTISAATVQKTLRAASDKSQVQEFWHIAALAVKQYPKRKSRTKDEEQRLGLFELSALMHSMLLDALAHDLMSEAPRPTAKGKPGAGLAKSCRTSARLLPSVAGDLDPPVLQSHGSRSSLSSNMSCDSARGGDANVNASLPAQPGPVLPAASLCEQETWSAVLLHVYDVSTGEVVRWFNDVLAHTRSPLKIGGAFHAGVEVNGLEWCFGYCPGAGAPGIECVRPKGHPNHHYRQSVFLGRTPMSAEQIAAVLGDLVEEYPGRGYSLLRRNCCHFADEFCQRLGVGNIPGWVHRLARFGASADGVLQLVMAGLSSEVCEGKGTIASSVCTQGATQHNNEPSWVKSGCLESWSVRATKPI
mmetsp:Transcript_38945/g.70906  ORF Transcript_38945/g.70906 Transcript_38945/m.70906 type:complete len:494 (-) Transcript_38945:58-1539(-)